MFQVDNPKHLKYDEADAVKCYALATAAVEQEYHLIEHVAPTFTLKLGADRDGIDWDHSEIQLKRWDRRMFRQGVIGLSLNELMKSSNLVRIELHIEHEEEATVDVNSLKH